MTRVYWDASDGTIYKLNEKCTLQTLIDEQASDSGVLIHCGKRICDFIIIADGRAVEYMTVTKHDFISVFSKLCKEIVVDAGTFEKIVTVEMLDEAMQL